MAAMRRIETAAQQPDSPPNVYQNPLRIFLSFLYNGLTDPVLAQAKSLVNHGLGFGSSHISETGSPSNDSSRLSFNSWILREPRFDFIGNLC